MADIETKSLKPGIVAVAGGTGFVGGAIARELASRGRQVAVLSHRHRPAGSLGSAPNVELRQADATEPSSLPDALHNVDTLVIALAFRNYPVEAPRRGQTFELIDAAGTEALVRAAKEAGIRRLIYISGAGTAADATKSWFRAKWRAEEAVRRSTISYTIFRPSWIYGPGDHSLNRFLGFARWLPFVPQIGNGRQQLAPIFIDDMAALVADSLDTPGTSNAIFEVGGPETLSMDEVVRGALHISGRRRFILHAPVTLMKIVTAPLVVLPSPPMRPSAIDFVVQSAPVDTTHLREIFPRKLHTVHEGLATYMSRPARQQ